jgi:protein phosphatase
VKYAARSDVGRKRAQNEDAWRVVLNQAGQPVGLVVADGMGGHQAGEVASRIAVEVMGDTLRNCAEIGSCLEDVEQLLRDGLLEANQEILAYAARNLSGVSSGTTLTAAYLDGPMLLLVHLGDSRAYLLRNGAVRQLSRDHTWVAELVASGALRQEEVKSHPERNKITRALGFEMDMQPDFLWERLLPEDQLLLCTDGLTEYVSEAEMAETLMRHTPQEAAARLVDLANRRGGRDNITVVIAAVEPGDLP